MNNDNRRRSARDNIGVPPDRLGKFVTTQPRTNRRREDRRFASTQNLQNVDAQPGASRRRSAEDVRSVRTNASSVASSIRRRQREIDFRATEELARIEAEQEEIQLQSQLRQLDRERQLIRLRQQNDVENLHEEWSDDSQDLEELDNANDDWGGNNDDDQVRDQPEAQVRDQVPASENHLQEDDQVRGHVPVQVPDQGPYRFSPNYMQVFSNTSQERYPAREELRAPNNHEHVDQDHLPVSGWFSNNEACSQPQQQYRFAPPRSPDEVETSDIGKLADILKKAFEQPARKQKSDDKQYLARQTIGKVKLPDFEGDPMEWPTFFAQYTTSSDECGFSDSENIVRLRGCLKKKARDCVKALLVSPDNLEEILETLKSNFGRKDQIIWSLIENVKKVNPPKENDFNSTMEFSNSVRNMCATMKTLKSKPHLQNPQLLRDLVNKLPGNLRYDWGKLVAKSDDEMTLEEFADWLKETTKAFSYTAVGTTTSDDRFARGGKRESSFNLEDDKKKCCTCNSTEHKITECKKFKALELNARWKVVNEKKLCYCCLKMGHRASACRFKRICGLEECKRFHHRLLHKPMSDSREPQEHNSATAKKTEESHSVYGIGTAHLPILPVIVTGPSGEIRTFALLDEGSTATFLDANLATEIGIEGPSDPLVVNVMNGSADDVQSQRVTFTIRGDYSDARPYRVNGARTVKSLNVGKQSLDFDRLKDQYGFLDGLPISSYIDAKPRLLLGQPDKLLSLARKFVHQGKQAPVAYKTSLGWVVCGKFARNGDTERSFCITEDEELHKMVKDSFSVESFGVRVTAEKPRSNEDKRAEDIMKATTKRIGEEFETGLLWKHDDVKFPLSWNNAFWRLKCQEKKMDKDSVFAAAMCGKIEEYVEKGFIRKLRKDEVTRSEREWYLPFFGVYNPNKPGKMRLVYDAAAKVNEISLNSSLLQGPDYLNPLPVVLWKFRQRRIAFGADITDMYHRVKIIKEDLPSQRFLWRGMERDQHPDVYEIMVMIFGAACSPSSAQYVKNENAKEFVEEFPEACQAIIDLFYVDDYLDGCDEEREATRKIKDVIEVNRRGGFTICKWVTNSKDVLKSIPAHLRAEGLKELDGETFDLPTGRTLGVWWNAELDVFTFKLALHKVDKKILSGESMPSKRELLRLVMSVFDPLGFLAHLMIKAKILLQDVWRNGTGWDEPIPTILEDKWKFWLEELKKIENVRIPRCYSINIPKADSIQLHVFCDASELAFAAVAYLRIQMGNSVDTSIVAGKTRVASLKPMSIPRMELQAAVMGSRLASSIRDNLDIKIDEVYLWSDSQTVLFWIRSEARNYKQFVSHRLGEILELTDVENWRWIPTKDNVSDDATRRNTESDLSNESRWFHGPSFLKNDATTWPKEEFKICKPKDEDLETKREFVNYVTENVISQMIDNCSSYRKVVRVHAWILRFIDASLKNDVKTSYLSVEETERAEQYVVRNSQRSAFYHDIEALRLGKPLDKTNKLFKLSPFLDEDGVLRMRGRLQNADYLSEAAKCPIILDARHKLTKLLIQKYHEDFEHQGRNTVVNKLHEKYWIIGLRSAVRKCARECQVCKNRNATPDIPVMASLPTARVTPFIRPFTFTGMDFFGPYDVIIGRRHEKRYGVLFTCLTTRAVHIEKADSLTTDSCIMAIDRFTAEREKPQEIFCDNGTNFRGAERELANHVKGLDSEKMQRTLCNAGMKWNFNPPGAPHMGGSWERLVRSIKVAMGEAVKKPVRDEVLLTAFKNASYVVNSRPLTEVTVDPDEPVALTPNHFLIGPYFNVESMQDMDEDEEFSNDDLRLRRQWRIAQRLVDLFWTRWIKEYLPTITKRTKWFVESRKLEVGDICVVVDQSLPRNTWPLGRIVAVHPGKDDRVRSVDITVKGHTYRRPVSKLARLDVRKDSET